MSAFVSISNYREAVLVKTKIVVITLLPALKFHSCWVSSLVDKLAADFAARQKQSWHFAAYGGLYKWIHLYCLYLYIFKFLLNKYFMYIVYYMCILIFGKYVFLFLSYTVPWNQLSDSNILNASYFRLFLLKWLQWDKKETNLTVTMILFGSVDGIELSLSGWTLALPSASWRSRRSTDLAEL